MLPQLLRAPNPSRTVVPVEVSREVSNPVVAPTLLVQPGPESNTGWGHPATPQTPLQGRTPGADVALFAGFVSGPWPKHARTLRRSSANRTSQSMPASSAATNSRLAALSPTAKMKASGSVLRFPVKWTQERDLIRVNR